MTTALIPVRRLRPLFDEDRCPPRRFRGLVSRVHDGGGTALAPSSATSGGMRELIQRQEKLENQIGQLVTTLQSMTVQPPAVIPPAPVQPTRSPVVRRERKVEPGLLSKFFD